MFFHETDAEIEAAKKEYAEKLASMTDEELYKEAKQKIWLSAYANNNPNSRYHWQCDATGTESDKREGNIYSNAWDAVYKEAGY